VSVVRVGSTLAATVAMGLVAGVFALYAHTVMPALRASDDRTFVAAFQALDRAIVNPWFMGTAFGGALVATLGAALANLGRPAFGWIAAALALYLVAVVITVVVHLPLNDAIKAAGDPDRIADLAAVRQRFDEARWAAWNLVRALTSGTAFGLLAWALTVVGRTGL
jgi:uncharacterized membrane protein